MNKKKKSERFYLERFLDLLGILPDEILEGESPDFIIRLQGKNIGIEVTEYHSGSTGADGRPRRAIEENWSQLQEKIMEEVENHEELRNTNGLLFFKKLELPPRSKYKEFTDELIRLSFEMINSSLQETRPGKIYPLLNIYLKKFFLEKVSFYIMWDWNYNIASVGITEGELIDAIKSKMVANYRDNQIHESWLLIISGHRLSQAMGIDLSYNLRKFDMLNHLLSKSSYNKVYIYQFMFYVIYEWPIWIKIGR